MLLPPPAPALFAGDGVGEAAGVAELNGNEKKPAPLATDEDDAADDVSAGTEDAPELPAAAEGAFSGIVELGATEEAVEPEGEFKKMVVPAAGEEAAAGRADEEAAGLAEELGGVMAGEEEPKAELGAEAELEPGEKEG